MRAPDDKRTTMEIDEMRVATWAIQERESVLEDAVARLPPSRLEEAKPALEVVLRAFVARLSGAAVHPSTVEEIRGQHGAGALLTAAQAVATALRLRAEAHAGHVGTSAELQTDRTAISSALDELIELFDPGAALDFDVEDGAWGVPRPTLVHALDELARAPPSAVDGPPVAGVLLRVRATSASAARVLDASRASLARLAPPPTFWPSASDELLLAAPVDDGAGRLVRAAAALFQSAGARAAELQGAIVVVGDDPLAAVVRASALATHAGLVLFDEQAWVLASSASAALAPAPGVPRAIDPAAAFGTDRWELSALLVRTPLFGRDDEIARLAAVLSGTHASAPDIAATLPVTPTMPLAPAESRALALTPTESRALPVTPASSPALPRTPTESPAMPLTRALPVLVALHGPAGIGKTSLVRAALREAGFVGAVDDESAVAVLWGRADSAEPLAPIAGMLRALADAPAGHPRAAARVRRLVEGLAARLEDAAARELTRLLPVIAALLGTVDEDPPLSDEADPVLAAPRAAGMPRASGRMRAAVRRAFLLVAEAMSAGAKRDAPVVIVIPGAEALDAPSRDVLAFAAARLGARARVLLLSSTRLKLPTSFEGTFHVERMELRGLGPGPARELVGALLDSDDQSVSLEPLLEKGRGSPLALVHAVRFAIEGGLLRRREDRWDLGGLDARDIPGRLDRLLRARVERLPPDVRALLSACALLGPVLLPAAAEHVGVRLGSNRDDVARALAFLVDTGFLARVLPRPAAPLFRDVDEGASGAVSAERPLAFEHPLLRLAALAAATDDEKKRLHALVAEALEATGSAADSVDDRALAVSLARHHLLAGQRAPALARLAVAARRSALFDDRSTAAALADEGLALAGEDTAAGLPFLLVLEECAADRPARHKEILARLARASDACTDAVTRARALVRIARYDLGVGDTKLAEDAAMRAIAALSTSDGPASARVRLEAARVLASARAVRGDLAGAAATIVDARAALASVVDDEARAALDHLEGAICLERGDLAAALEHLLSARARRVGVGDVAGEAACLDVIASVFARRGRLATSLALLEQALRLRDRIGDDEGRASTLRRQADVLLSAGDDTAALAASLEARALARDHGREDKEVAAGFVAVRAHLSLGDVAAAEALVEALRKRARTAHTQIEAAILGARVRLLRASSSAGSTRERALRVASSRAREAMVLAEKHGAAGALVASMAAAGECRLLEGDPGAALTFAQQAVELLDIGAPGITPLAAAEDVLGPYARVLAAMGDDEEAASVRARAVVILEESARHLPPAARARFWSAPRRAELRVTSLPSAAQ